MAINKSLILLAVLAGFCLSSSGFQVKGAISVTPVSSTTHMIDSNGWYHVFGEVNNPLADNMSRVVYVTASFTSGYSSFASAKAFTTLDTIKPGEKASFNIVLADSAKSSLVDIGYTLSLVTDDRLGNLPYRLSATATSNFTDGNGNYHVNGTVTNN
ncbi:MAG: hypothetical protein NTX81_10445, partial [Candidatus Bathyarchaeota archaeon]|nr:hypothetical protein [Candidatus Bathyarchaeota archaeon]